MIMHCIDCIKLCHANIRNYARENPLPLKMIEGSINVYGHRVPAVPQFILTVHLNPINVLCILAGVN